MTSFNLVTENWIPTPSGVFSLYDLFAKSQEIEMILADTPIQTSSLYMLAITIVQAAYRGMNEEVWARLWRQGCFDDEVVNGYLKKWLERFDLFSEVYPFMQDVDLHLFVKKHESISSLFPNMRSGADAIYKVDNFEYDPIVSAASAARAVITIQSYGIAGTKGRGLSFTDASATRQPIFIIVGENLFETILLNIFSYPTPSLYFSNQNGDLPIWERDPSDYFVSENRPIGLLDYMTWLNRRIKLIPMNTDGGLAVQFMYYSVGLKLPESCFHPFSKYIYRKKKKKTEDNDYYPYRLDRSNVLWKDLAAIVQVFSGDDCKDITPYNLVWVKEMIEKGIVPRSKLRNLNVLGQITEMGRDKTRELIQERIPLPLNVLSDENIYCILSDAINYALGCETILYTGLKLAAAWLVMPEEDNIKILLGNEFGSQRRDSILASWMNSNNYWGKLQPHFYKLLDSLSSEIFYIEEWKVAVNRAGLTSFDEIVSGLDTANLNRAFFSARSYIVNKLRKLGAEEVA